MSQAGAQSFNLIYNPQEKGMNEDDFNRLIGDNEKKIKEIEENLMYYSLRMAEYGKELTDKHNQIEQLRSDIRGFKFEIFKIKKDQNKTCTIGE